MSVAADRAILLRLLRSRPGWWWTWTEIRDAAPSPPRDVARDLRALVAAGGVERRPATYARTPRSWRWRAR